MAGSSKAKEPRGLSYTYTPLANLRTNGIFNIYAVVKFVNRPGVSVNGENYQQLSVIDPSLDDGDKMCVMIFSKTNVLPLPSVGDIIRFHRVVVKLHNGKQQCTAGQGFHWVIFEGINGSGFAPKKSSSANYSIHPTVDHPKITELREWCDTVPLSQIREDYDKNFASIAAGDYFNIVAQVVAKCVVDAKSVLIRVWDGTKVNGPTVKVCVPVDKVIKEDVSLKDIAQPYTYDVCAFDDHVAAATKVEPGDIVYIRNLHAMISSGSTGNQLEKLEFCLHGKGQELYNRGVRVLLNGSQMAQKLLLILDQRKRDFHNEILTKTTGCFSSVLKVSEELTQEFSSWNSEGMESNISVLANLVDKDQQSKPRDSEESQTGLLSVCMERNASYIVNQKSISRSTIHSIRLGRVPQKFRARVFANDFFPKSDTVEDFIHGYCSVCNYLKSMKQVMKDLKTDMETQKLEYKCPECSKSSQGDSVGAPRLQLTFALQFLLTDETGWLVAVLWQDQADLFFSSRPEQLLRAPENYQVLKNRLLSISGLDSEAQPLECCIKSYNTELGHCYQMFDTKLILTDESPL